MNEVLLDTDTLSFFMRGDEQVVVNARKYLQNYDALNISIITKYEILSGLFHRDAHSQLAKFKHLLKFLNIMPLDDQAIEIAAFKYAETRRLGNAVDDIDLLIAGTALANNLVIVTHNTKHFSKISTLPILDWKP